MNTLFEHKICFFFLKNKQNPDNQSILYDLEQPLTFNKTKPLIDEFFRLHKL